MLVHSLATGLLFTVLLAPPTAVEGPAVPSVPEPEGPGMVAQPDPDRAEGLELAPEAERDVEKARDMFATGSAAVTEGRYAEALEFFREAYRLSGRPTLLYSLAQAHRLQYQANRSTVSLGLALKRYNEYLRLAPDGKKRDAAASAIAELRPLAEVEIGGFDEEAKITRLMVATTAEKALVSLDGGDPTPAPIVADVEPGEHRVRVFAEGYYDASQTVEVPEGSTVPVQIELADKEATLMVTGPKGGQVTVDTREIGTLPLDAPLQLEPGVHRVAVVRNGRTAFALEIDLERAEERTLDSTLYMSTQRKVGWGLLGVGAAGLITGGALTAVALDAQTRALALDDKRVTVSITEAELAEYHSLRDRRDTMRTGAAAGLSVGTALTLTSAFILLFNTPRVDAMTQYTREAALPGPDESEPSISLVPTWGGAVLNGRF